MSAKDALQVMDFEEAARRVAASRALGLHGQRLGRRPDAEGERRGVHAHPPEAAAARRRVETGSVSTEVFGVRWETPLFICPVGGQRAFHAGRRDGHRARREGRGATR